MRAKPLLGRVSRRQLTPKVRSRGHLGAVALLALLSALVFAPHLHAPFLYDDTSLILSSEAVQHLASRVSARLGAAASSVAAPPPVHPLWSPRYWTETHVGTRGVYRPLREGMFALLLALFGPSPAAFHGASFVLHTVLVWLAYGLGLTILRSRGAAAVGAAFFAVHPVHNEAVQWAKNLAEVFGGVALAGAALLFLRACATPPDPTRPARRGAALLAAALALYALGLLAKETTLALPVLLLATLTALPPALRRRAAAWSAPFWALALAYAAFQFAHFGIAGAVVRGMQPVPEPDEALWLRPALAAKTYAYYLRLLLWPMNLSAQHHFYFPINYHGPHAWPWLVGCAAALAASVGLARMRPDWLALIVWPWACLAPVSNLVPFRGRPIGEQRLYAPSIGFCLLFGALYHALVTQRRVPPVWMRLARCLFAATMLVFLFQAVNRSAVWDEPRRFWMDLARKSPIQTTANAALAEIYLAADLPNVALNHCDLATHYYDSRQFEPENFGALMTQAEAMERLGALDEAVGCYQRILKHQPGNDRAALGIGRALGVQGRHEEALAVFLDVARRRPEHSTAHLNAGLALCNLGRVEEGLAALRRARDFSPADLSVSLDIAKALAQLGREQEARREFEAVYRAARLRLRERPGDPEAARLWAHAALALGLRDEAEAALRTLQQTRPLPGTR